MLAGLRRHVPAVLLVPVLAVLALLTVLVAVTAGLLLTHRIAAVETHGVSMNPLFYQGDLVVVTKSSNYHVGEVAAYRLPHSDTVVLHRIIAMNDTGFTFKGDNNQSVDPWHPAKSQIVGRAIFHISGGGVWLKRGTELLASAVLAALLLAGNGVQRRRRRKDRRNGMSRHSVSRTRETVGVLRTLSPPLVAASGFVAVAALLGVLLGGLAWTAPLHHPISVQTQQSRHVGFSYTATVRRSAAYDGTQVRSPDPIFRAVAGSVTVHLAYTGAPGTMSVTAELSATSGWHSTVPLAPAAAITPTTTVTLDLAALGAKAQAGAKATGIAAGPVNVTVQARISTAGEAAFLPSVRLTLTSQQLSLSGAASTLSVTTSTTRTTHATRPGVLVIASHSISVATARLIALFMLLGCALGAGVILVLNRREHRFDEPAIIHRRYGQLLVVVQPVTAAPGRPIVDVTNIVTLVKLAERYGLLILCWTRSGVETFLVQDENTTYRYRTGTATAPRTEQVMATV